MAVTRSQIDELVLSIKETVAVANELARMKMLACELPSTAQCTLVDALRAEFGATREEADEIIESSFGGDVLVRDRAMLCRLREHLHIKAS